MNTGQALCKPWRLVTPMTPSESAPVTPPIREHCEAASRWEMESGSPSAGLAQIEGLRLPQTLSYPTLPMRSGVSGRCLN
ncbi:hypothetical protein AAFF_G00101200 [Aldrovandia affinis]|uniref:Uncharacterized protein n=1 Tax=Aldrovandia affinis TaxID=143900 RepID=A0AAD7RV12_9TELE|nr:hypothetical protein AAFF_G00101200 [Aldrovandia affinis]